MIWTLVEIAAVLGLAYCFVALPVLKYRQGYWQARADTFASLIKMLAKDKILGESDLHAWIAQEHDLDHVRAAAWRGMPSPVEAWRRFIRND